MPAENTIMSVSRWLPSANTMRCVPDFAVDDRQRVLAAWHLHAQFFDLLARSTRAPDRRPAPPSGAARIRPRGSPGHVAQRLGAFQAQQAAADHHAGLRALRRIRASLPGLRWCGRRSSPRSLPGTGGTKGYEPVASTSLS
jgi:hypothetical protein